MAASYFCLECKNSQNVSMRTIYLSLIALTILTAVLLAGSLALFLFYGGTNILLPGLGLVIALRFVTTVLAVLTFLFYRLALIFKSRL